MIGGVQCLYCRHHQQTHNEGCECCGMPLPDELAVSARRQRRFLVFFVLLAFFCAAMMVWLPRSVI